MFRARFIIEGEKPAAVRADLYKPEQHGTHLVCADPDCSARMRFQKEVRTQGAIDRTAHFVSLDVKEHRKDCKAWEISSSQSVSETLDDAFRKDHYILLHLNMKLGIPRLSDFEKAVKRQRETTQLRFFRASFEGRYKTLSVKTVVELIDILQLIAQKKPTEYKGHIVVSHGGMVINGNSLSLGTQARESEHLYLMATRRAVVYDDKKNERLYGFPRLVKLVPTSHSRASGTKAPIRSRYQKMHRHEYEQVFADIIKPVSPLACGFQDAVFLHTVFFSGTQSQECADLARKIKSAYVLAVPYLSYADHQKIADVNAYDYKSDDRTKYVGVSWRVVSPEQFYVLDSSPVEAPKLQKPGKKNISTLSSAPRKPRRRKPDLRQPMML